MSFFSLKCTAELDTKIGPLYYCTERKIKPFSKHLSKPDQNKVCPQWMKESSDFMYYIQLQLNMFLFWADIPLKERAPAVDKGPLIRQQSA